MPRLLMATFNIPCSGAGTIVLLTFTQETTSISRQIYGINVDSSGNQAQYIGGYEYDISITINNGIANVEAYTSSPPTGATRFRCCFIPGDPLTENIQ